MWWFIRHTLTPIPKGLPEAARKVALPVPLPSAEDLKQSLESVRKLVDSAEARATLLRTKANALLTIVSLEAPLLSWWLTAGRDRLVTSPRWVTIPAYCFIALATCCIALALLAVFRTQRVASFPSLTIHHMVNLQSGELKSYDISAEVQALVGVWGGIERQSDLLADYLRAGQRFLGLSLIFAICAGAFTYFQPTITSVSATVAQIPNIHVAHSGAATITLPGSCSLSDILLGLWVSLLLGAGIVWITLFCFRSQK